MLVKKELLKQEKEELEKKLSELDETRISMGNINLTNNLNKPFSGKDADAALGDAGITVNKNTVPGETRSPFVTSGIRIGSPALTARGMKEKEFEYIANKICDVLDNIEDKELHKK